MSQALKKYKFWLILIFLFLFLRLPSLFEPYWYGDEGIYLVLGQAIRKGVTLYKNIHDNKPPTLYYLAAISHTVFGFRFLLLVVMAPAVYFFNRLCRYFLGIKKTQIATIIFLVLTSIPLFEGNIANAEIFMLLPTILGVLLLTKNKPGIKTIIFSGLLLGLAFTIKIPVVFEFAFLCLWLFISDFSSFKNITHNLYKIIIFVLSFFFPTLIWAFYFYLQGALQPFLASALLQNIGYLSSWATGTHSSSLASGGLINRFIILLILWLIVFLLKIKKIITSQFSFLLFWFFATIFGALLSGRPYPHYLIQVLPPLSILIIKVYSSQKIKNTIVALLSLIVLILAIYKYNFYFYPVLRYYTNFYSYILGRKSLADYRSSFGYSVNQTYQISDYIKNHTTSQDKIFIWGDEPYIYALTDRLPTSKYTVAYHISDFNGYQITIDKIKATLPKYIVYYPMSNRPFSDLDLLIEKYYFLSTIIGNAKIYQIR